MEWGRSTQSAQRMKWRRSTQSVQRMKWRRNTQSAQRMKWRRSTHAGPQAEGHTTLERHNMLSPHTAVKHQVSFLSMCWGLAWTEELWDYKGMGPSRRHMAAGLIGSMRMTQVGSTTLKTLHAGTQSGQTPRTEVRSETSKAGKSTASKEAPWSIVTTSSLGALHGSPQTS
eukprot:scaffold215275_cov28-Tisochrysis_lutea.AAC.1